MSAESKFKVKAADALRGFMGWLYQQDLADLDGLPDYVELEPVH